MEQSSSMDKIETWLEVTIAYKSVANITKSHSHHTNEIIRDSYFNHAKEAKQPNKMV